MKIDLLTYPLPWPVVWRPDRSNGKRKFGLINLVESSLESGIDMVGITSYTNYEDAKAPDIRFRWFWEDRVNLPQDYKVTPFPWSQEDSTLVAFSVQHKNKKVTFLYNQNGPTKFEGNDIRLLRVGPRYFCPPGQNIEEAIEQAKENNAIVLIDPRDVFKTNIHDLINSDGMYWYAGLCLPPNKDIQEISKKIILAAEKAVIPVSGTKMPFFGKPLKNKFEGIGIADIELKQNISDDCKTGEELIYELSNAIKKGTYIPHMQHASILQTLFREAALTARKKIFRSRKYDYSWPESSPEDIFVKL